MWIVKLALRRSYTFVVLALLILVLGGLSTHQMRTDVFPEIDIPVVTVIWTYKGMDTGEVEKRITTFSEYAYSSNVNDLRRMESQTVNGVAVVRLHFHPGTDVNAAISQVTAVSQAIRQIMPPSVQPPIILRFNASSVPVLQLSLSSDTLSEADVYDYALWQLRTQLATIQGLTQPTPYGGMERQIMVDLDPRAMQARGVTANDVTAAVNAHNLALPTGVARIGTQQYPVAMNNTPLTAEAFNNVPIKYVNGATVYVRDVAQVRDGYAAQTTVVRRDGKRGALVTLFKNGNASTLDIVRQVKAKLPELRAAAPEGLQIDPLFDQSLFVEAAVGGVVTESVIAGLLTATMILVFLGSWRSTLIVATSIPLSILASIAALYALGHSLNVMTLGGLALAVGILVDDATVEIENIHRNLHQGKPLRQAILDGAMQIAGPTFVSTLTICIVFVSVVFLKGPAKYLFTPMALAVVFAMLASYLLSRTLVPVMVKYLLPGEIAAHGKPSLLGRFFAAFESVFEAFRSRYVAVLSWNLRHPLIVFAVLALVLLAGIVLTPRVGRDFFPTVDAGQFRLHVRAPAGTRLEETERHFSRVEQAIREIIPADEVDLIIDNVGLPNRSYSLAFGDSATTGMGDGEILVSLKHSRRKSTPAYVADLRRELPARFPELTFYFQPADVVSQILNYGLPAPIDVQVAGPDRDNNERIARRIAARMQKVPGVVDVHVHQVTNVPTMHVEVDQTRAAQLGMTQQDVANNLLTSLSGSGQVQPNYWVDPNNGISYLVEVRTPIHQVTSADAIHNIPLTSKSQEEPQILANVATIQRKATPEVINHTDVQPTFDVYASVQGRDLGSVAGEIDRILDEHRGELKPGNSLTMRGQVESMRGAFWRLGLGIAFAAVLVYLLMVVNFQSWLDPFIIVLTLPAALLGVVLGLYLTGTTFSVPALMGAIMTIGVATANSILIVTFANEQRREGKSPLEAALEAGRTRLRPVLMTALAMITGMLPMALGLGEGGEQNAPLGRAVIGGLVLATASTLLFVPVAYRVLRRGEVRAEEAEE